MGKIKQVVNKLKEIYQDHQIKKELREENELIKLRDRRIFLEKKAKQKKERDKELRKIIKAQETLEKPSPKEKPKKKPPMFDMLGDYEL